MSQLIISAKLLVDVNLKGFNIIIPDKYIQKIISTTNPGDITIFSIEDTGILVSVLEYSTLNNIYVSNEIYQLIKHKKTLNYGLININRFTDFEKGDKVIFEPLNTTFLQIKDQLTLLQDYICHHIRLLYPKQEFKIYSKEINNNIKFRVISTNNTKYKVITAIDTDLNVDFDCKLIIERMKLPKQFRDPISIFIKGDGKHCAIDYIKN
jgi:hypothetical protein